MQSLHRRARVQCAILISLLTLVLLLRHLLLLKGHYWRRRRYLSTFQTAQCLPFKTACLSLTPSRALRLIDTFLKVSTKIASSNSIISCSILLLKSASSPFQRLKTCKRHSRIGGLLMMVTCSSVRKGWKLLLKIMKCGIVCFTLVSSDNEELLVIGADRGMAPTFLRSRWLILIG